MRFDCKTTKDTKYRKTKQGTNTKPHKQCELIAKLERTQSVAKQNNDLTQNPTNNVN